MAHLSLQFLGTAQATLNGVPVTDFRSKKALALLAYLAVENGRAHSREWLSGLLWPDQPDEAARTNLRQTLTRLRQSLQDDAAEQPILLVTKRSVELNPDAQVWLDVAEFETLVTACLRHPHRAVETCPECLERCRRAADLYRGDLLQGFYVEDSTVFDEWGTIRREGLHQRALRALAVLTSAAERQREYDSARAYARRLLELEPWHEEGHRSLMRALAMSGQRGAALRQYDLCRRILREEFGVEPTSETTALFAAIRDESIAPLPPETVNPYKGLHYFTQEDSANFFGRERCAERLAAAIREHPLAAVIGPSGSGKSSIIFAGLIPRLAASARDFSGSRAGAGPNGWLVAAFRPGRQPFEHLAAALCPLLATSRRPAVENEMASLCLALERGEGSLATVVRRILDCHPGAAHLLLAADQFEELYVQCPDATLRLRFLDTLLVAARSEPEGAPSLSIVIGLRADFLGQALAYRPFADALEAGGLMLGSMDRSEMAQAIERPAEAQGVRFEAGLVARLLDDVGDEPGNLPLLEFALTVLWDHAPDSVLTHAAYEEIGGVRGALAAYAERVFGEMSAEEQEIARRVFLQLVRPAYRSDDTRRIALRRELGEAEWLMAQRLADARLAVTGRDAMGEETVEIVHEALLTGWGRFQAWIDADRAFRIWQERLRLANGQWEASGHDEDALLRGSILTDAEQWAGTHYADLDPALRSFLTASLERRQAESEAIEERTRQELAMAQTVAASRAVESRRLRRLSVALGLVVLLISAVAIMTVKGWETAARYADRALMAQATAEAQRSQTDVERKRAEAETARAENEARQSLSYQLAAQAGSLLNKETDLAILLSLEALRLADPGEQRANALLGLRLDPHLKAFLHGSGTPVYGLAFTPACGSASTDGSDPTCRQTLVSVTSDGIVTRWDPSNGRREGDQFSTYLSSDAVVSLSPDGVRAAYADGPEVTVIDVVTGRQVRPALGGYAARVRAVVFSADHRTLLTGAVDGTILRWDLDDGLSSRVPITDTTGGAWALSPDGQRLAMTVDAAEVGSVGIRVMDVATGRQIGPVMAGHKPGAAIHSMTFSPDGRTLASASFDNTVILWDVEKGEELHPPLAAHTARALVAAFSPDGHILATGGADNAVYLWDVATGKSLGPALEGHSNWIRSLAFVAPGGGDLILASGSTDGTIILWDLGQSRELAGHTAQARGVAFGLPGQCVETSCPPDVFAGGMDQAVLRWNTADDRLGLMRFQSDDHSSLNLALSPPCAGRPGGSSPECTQLLAVASASGDIHLWDTGSGRRVGQPLRGHTGPVVSVAFSPDGKTLASGSFDNSVMLWDVGSGQRIGQPLQGHTNWVLTVAFSPDGKTLASGSADGTIRLWDAATGSALGTPLRGHSNWVTSLAFSPDGKTLVSGSSDNSVVLWDVASRQPDGLPLTGHTSQVWSVFFDPVDQGRSLYSVGEDGTVIHWDLATREPTAPPLLGNVEVETAAVSPDGSLLALAGFDGVVHLWQVDRRAWSSRACQIANRNLTPAEWRQYLHDTPYRKTCPELP